MPNTLDPGKLNEPPAMPIATYADCPDSADCYQCDENAEFGPGHTHEVFEVCEGASLHTADELADLFLDACEFFAAPWWRPEYCPRDVEGWLEDPDDAQALFDCITLGEGALADHGLSASWNDGYAIERVTETEG